MSAFSKKNLDVVPLLKSIEEQMPLLDAQWAGAELYGAPRFSVFDLFEPRELTLSRIIAELLDPNASHGQGTLFLNALLSHLGLSPINIREAVRVNREVTTKTGRRIDIVVDTAEFIVGIENKPWAEQQENQLSDYWNELKHLAGKKKFRLVFLSNQGAKTAKGEVVELPYQASEGHSSLHEILRTVVETIKATRTRAFVKDFLRYIELQFGEGQMATDDDIPYVTAVRTEFAASIQKRKAIGAVLLAQPRIYDEIFDDIAKFLLQRLRSTIAEDFVLGTKETLRSALEQRYTPWAVRRKTWPANCWLVIEAEQTRQRSVYFGIRAPDPKSKEVEKGAGCKDRTKLAELTKKVPGGRQTAWFPWWRYCEPLNWDLEAAAWGIIESPTGRLEDLPNIQDLAARFVELARAVDECLEI
jgi:hypothetical protein